MVILLIEDCPSDAEVLASYFREEGHLCTLIDSLPSLANADLCVFDFAVIDLHVGGSEPEETLTAMDATGIPYVVMTGDKNPEVIKEVGKRQVLGIGFKNPEDMEALAAYALGQAQAAKVEQERIRRAAAVFKDGGTDGSG